MTDQIVPAQHLADATGAVLGMPAGAAPVRPWPGRWSPWMSARSSCGRPRRLPGAEPALFVHGLGGSALNWTDLMGLLSEPPTAKLRAHGYRRRAAGPLPLAGEALDLPGFGYSPPPADGDYSLDARAAAVIALIEQRGNWPVHLVGNSLGGADQHPRRRAPARPGPHADADLARAARPAAAAAARRASRWSRCPASAAGC